MDAVGLKIVAIVLTIVVVGILAEPASAEHEDAEDAGVHQADVEFLRQVGVFEGTECSPGKFCPKEPLERWVMAVWLVRILDGEDPSSNGDHGFVDVDEAEWWRPYVERLADLEVTRGCSDKPLRFCPYDNVTRAQMAAFLLRAYNLIESPSFGFTDTAGNAHETSIDALAEARITFGCKADPLMYCPDREVTRAQMASFLVRAMPDQYINAVDRVFSTESPIDPFAVPSSGEIDIDIPVYYCDSDRSIYTESVIRDEVTRLNESSSVSGFYLNQSSGKARVTFVVGGTVSPTEVNWTTETITDMSSKIDSKIKQKKTNYFDDIANDCEKDAVTAAGDNRQIVVLVDVPEGANSQGWSTLGYAWRGNGPAVLPTRAKASSSFERTFAHEIGHSVFDFEHPNVPPKNGSPILDPDDCSIMSYIHYMPKEKCKAQIDNNHDLGHSYIWEEHKKRWNWPVVELPGKVRSLTATIDSSTPTVSWLPPSDDGGAPIDGYRVSYANVNSLEINTTSHTITGLRSANYVVKVSAYNSRGSGPESEITVQVQGIDHPGEPTPPVVEAGDGQLQVRWSPPPDGGSPITSYQVSYRILGSGSWTVLDIGTSLSTTITGLENGTAYEVDLRAANAIDWGPWSDRTIVELPLRQPAPPTVVATVSGTTIKASWSANSGSSQIDMWEIGGVGEVPASTTSYRWPNQSPGAYRVRVRARSAEGWSDWGKDDVTVPPQVKLTVGDKAGTQGGTRTPEYEWETCRSVHCRWLHIRIEGFEQPGPHKLACLNYLGPDSTRGTLKRQSPTYGGPARLWGHGHDTWWPLNPAISAWPANRNCFLGFPGDYVYVVVGDASFKPVSTEAECPEKSETSARFFVINTRSGEETMWCMTWEHPYQKSNVVEWPQ